MGGIINPQKTLRNVQYTGTGTVLVFCHGSTGTVRVSPSICASELRFEVRVRVPEEN